MQELLVYSTKAYNDFSEEWLPHRNCNEFWSFYSILTDPAFGGSVYSLRLEIRNLLGPLESLAEVFFSLEDMTRATSYTRRYLLPHLVRSKQKELLFDHNSFFCQERIQILLENKNLALRIREDELSLDLSVEMPDSVCWADQDGGLQILSGPRPFSTLMGGWMPFLNCFAKLTRKDEESLRLPGKAAFERMWGCFPIQNAKAHWEKFYFILNDGTELALLDFPYGNSSHGFLLKPGKALSAFSGQKLTAVDTLEIEDWRFGSGWQLEIPELPTLYLVALQKDQFVLPVPRPVLGVYDEAGKHLGYAFAELMPGARNELNTVPITMHAKYLKESNTEIL
ncbi:MAG: hypothetical protein IJP07_05575 [Firmicutes bacterium]|nr:hypothetical protein [Bacillota bacterium]